MIFFWNRYELPAILSGQITSEQPRVAASSTTTTTTIAGHNDGNISAPSMSNSGQERQRMGTSYPSMSNLGRISSLDGYGYLTLLDGEVSFLYPRDHFLFCYVNKLNVIVNS